MFKLIIIVKFVIICAFSVFSYYSIMMLKENISGGAVRGLSVASKKNNISILRSIQTKFFRGPTQDSSIKKKNENGPLIIMKKSNIGPVVIISTDEQSQLKKLKSHNQTKATLVSQVQIYPKGLHNIGNTCYMNATLQCLFHLRGFRNLLVNQMALQLVKDKPVPPVANETYLAIKQMTKRDGGSLNLGGLKKSMGRRRLTFLGSAQQDAQQYLTGLLQILNEELSRIKQKAKYKELDGDPIKKSIQQISDEWWNYYREIDNSLVCDLFQGQMISTTKCKKCSKVTVNFDNIWGLPITFHKNMSVYELLVNNWKSETAIQDYYCSQCKKNRNCAKVTQMFRLPQNLVIQLKRFQFEKGQKKKRKEQIRIDKEINLSSLLNENASKSQNCNYKLKGIVHHQGQAQYGHYYAQIYCDVLKKWYILNDSSVDEATGHSKVSKTAYLLFYEQVC